MENYSNWKEKLPGHKTYYSNEYVSGIYTLSNNPVNQIDIKPIIYVYKSSRLTHSYKIVKFPKDNEFFQKPGYYEVTLVIRNKSNPTKIINYIYNMRNNG